MKWAKTLCLDDVEQPPSLSVSFPAVDILYQRIDKDHELLSREVWLELYKVKVSQTLTQRTRNASFLKPIMSRYADAIHNPSDTEPFTKTGC